MSWGLLGSVESSYCEAVEVSHGPLACAQVSCDRGSRGCVRWVPVSWVAFLQGSPGGASHVKLL